MIRIAAIAVITLLGLTTINLLYHVRRKPTEMFALISSEFDKAPADTWRHYGSLFREYSTAAISPELLAALAQVEGAGSPERGGELSFRSSGGNIPTEPVAPRCRSGIRGT